MDITEQLKRDVFGLDGAQPDRRPPNKALCEVFVGNLDSDSFDDNVVRDAVATLFKAIPGLCEAYPDSRDVITYVHKPVNPQGLFAFMGFQDETLASTAVAMSGFRCGKRRVRISRPRGYRDPPGGPAPPLDLSSLRRDGLLPAVPLVDSDATTFADRVLADAVLLRPAPDVSGSASGPLGDETWKRMCEVFLGNLKVGCVERELYDVIAPRCANDQNYRPECGMPVKSIRIHPTGKFAFVEFQNPDLATSMICTLHNVEVQGRPLKPKRTSWFEQYMRNLVSHGQPPPPPPNKVSVGQPAPPPPQNKATLVSQGQPPPPPPTNEARHPFNAEMPLFSVPPPPDEPAPCASRQGAAWTSAPAGDCNDPTTACTIPGSPACSTPRSIAWSSSCIGQLRQTPMPCRSRTVAPSLEHCGALLPAHGPPTQWTCSHGAEEAEDSELPPGAHAGEMA